MPFINHLIEYRTIARYYKYGNYIQSYSLTLVKI